MAKIIPIDEQFQHFLAEMKESFWGDLYGQTWQAWQTFFELESERQRDRFSGWAPYERRRGKRKVYRNGYYERDFVTRFGTIRLRIARTREKRFLPVGLRRFQRRAEEVSLLIREAFLRGISTRHVGRVVATITGETVSAQTVSKLTRDLDEAVRQFHQARLSDDYVYLFAKFRSGARQFTSLTRSDVEIRMYGMAAVVTDVDIVRGTFKGKDIGGQARAMRVWVKQPEGWQLVAAHATPLAP